METRPAGTEAPSEPGWHLNRSLTVRHRIDWQRFPSVVFESDDWGACEVAPDRAGASAAEGIFAQRTGAAAGVVSTLETPEDLERLYALLERCRGADGQPAIFTAFVSTGNPDYAAIRASGFSRYADIGIDRGVPAPWDRGDLVAAWRAGMARGVWAPEFHSNLHHTSPVLWLRLLREDRPEGDAARRLFELGIYYQGLHLPEYAAMNVREQYAWVRTGVDRFTRAVGRPPAAAVTSDAYPVTETVWSLNGIRTVCLKNSRNNAGEVVVYHTKPWNNQDTYAPIGAYNALDDLVYLSRNVYFECTGGPAQTAEPVLATVRRRWLENEPAVVSTHRVHYVSLDPARREAGFRELEKLLTALAAVKDVRFLSTGEIGDLYRQGWSVRRQGAGRLLRKWSESAAEIRLDGAVRRAVSLPEGREVAIHSDGDAAVLTPPVGDVWVE